MFLLKYNLDDDVSNICKHICKAFLIQASLCCYNDSVIELTNLFFGFHKKQSIRLKS
jgi:hypothetical protein